MAIILTEKAATEIKRVQVDQKLEDEMFLRVGVTDGGCSGFGYSMGFDSQYDPAADSKYEFHGVTVVVDRKSVLYLDGATVDWHDSNGQRGFTFDNPNAVSSCGCNCGH